MSINYIDMASGHAATFSGVGKAIAERRDQVYLQIHFGADYTRRGVWLDHRSKEDQGSRCLAAG